MTSAKTLVLSTLRSLTQQCIREQLRLVIASKARHAAEAEERVIRQRLGHIRAKVNRELLVNARLLGVRDGSEGDGSNVF